MDHKGPPRVTPSSDLVRLLSAEEELETMLAKARADAGALVEAAHAASRTATSDLEFELATADARFKQEVEAERAVRAEAVLAEARRRAAEYNAVTPGRIEALAERALARLLARMRE